MITVPGTPLTATVYAVTVTDQIDARIQPQSIVTGPSGSSGALVVEGSAFTASYASIPQGEQRVITFTGVVSDPLGGLAGDVVTNVATLNWLNGGPVPSGQTDFLVVEPSLTISKSSIPPSFIPVDAGQAVTYSLLITNSSGPDASPAYDIVVTDTIPVRMRGIPPELFGVTLNGTPLAASDFVTSYVPATGQLVVVISPSLSIPVGGNLLVNYVVWVDYDVSAGSIFVNNARSTWSSLPGPVPGDRPYGPITASTWLTSPVATGILKSVSPATASVGFSACVYG